MAERAGVSFEFLGLCSDAESIQYTVTMFLVDVSPSMGKVREVEVEQSNGETRIIEMTNLEWALQFVKLKVQEMVRHR
jgi:ATP-dependent DNA helicase 2 subunit 2